MKILPNGTKVIETTQELVEHINSLPPRKPPTGEKILEWFANYTENTLKGLHNDC